LTPGTDNFTGLAGDFNQFQFTPSTLQSTDTITGGATGSFLDILLATAGGSISSSQFQGVTLVEQLNLSSGGNNVALSNSLVAGSSVGYFAVVDGGGSDTVDATAITTTPIVFFAGAGSDTFKGGGGNDAVFIAPTNLTSADILQGGPGADNLYLNAAGTVSASAFANVSGFEGLSLSSFGNTVSLTNGLVTGASYFSVNDGGGDDGVNASAVTTTPIVFFAGAGTDTFTGGGGNDAVYIAVADLTSADHLQGGAGVDNLYLTTAGTVAGVAFTNVTGFEGLVLSGLGNDVTLTNSLVAGSNNGVFAVADGAGNDTVDASGVNNGSSVVIFASSGADTFKGGNGLNGYSFAVADLTSADRVVGGSAVDNLVFTTAGALAASAFTNVTGIEAIVLANGVNNVTLTNSLVAGTSIGYFAVVGGNNNDAVDASGITNGTAIVFSGTAGGNDNFTGGNGSDSFQFAAGQLTSGDAVTGGGGADTLWMTTAGTTNTADLAGVSGIEGVYLQNGGTFHLANGITAAAGLAATGSSAVDNFDASAVTTYSVSFTGNGGADTLIGGSHNDTFFIADSAFTSINGNGGIDRITLTGPSQSFNLTTNAVKISNLEVIDLNSSLNSTLTLVGTDIALVNASGTSLYVVGDVDDTVNAGNGYTQIASGVVNNAVAPGHTFYEFQHSSGSLLFIDSAITALTATTGTGSANVPEGTAAGATVFNAQQAGATTYVLGGADAALFSIDGTGHISFNASPNFETPLDQGTNNVYDLTVTSSNGTATPNFVETVAITVTNVSPSTPADSDGGTADSVAEGAAAGTYTGVTASSTDINGPAVSWSLTADSSGGGFTIGADGKINVLDASKINYETATHSYDVTAQASDGAGGTSSHGFTITVTNTNPSGPTDSDTLTANSVVEGASAGTYTGLTASSTDVNGPTVTWLLTADSSGGGFGIGADGKVVVADATKLDFETTGPGHTYSVTAQASDGAGGTASQSFNITVTNANPSNPADGDTATADTVDEGAAVGTYTGVTAAATDPNGPAVTWLLTSDTSGGGFTIGADGKINVLDATKINYETATHSYDVTAQASDGAGGTSSHLFTISVGDVAPSTPVDSDSATADSVSQNAIVGTYTGVTASSTDVNGPAVTWSLTNDTSGGGFGIDSTGKITVIDSSKITYNAGDPTFTVRAQASDGTLSSHQDFVITVVPNTAPTANADSLSATEKGGVNNATGGSNPTGNVITGTGGATADTDAETPGSLTVVSFGTGGVGNPDNGTVDGTTQLTGDHGTLTLATNGTFNYLVNQTDPAVQALVPASTALTDTFHYTIQDPGGLTSTAVITVSINGANDLPLAVTDTGVTFAMGEDAAPTSFLVRANDSLDPDTGAANTVAPGAVTVSGTPAGTTIGNADATAAAFNSNQEIQVTLGAAFQQLHAGETATVTVPYTLTGNAGETSTTNLVVTVNGANDVPIAVDDSGSMTEDQSGTAFTVLTGPGADTLDPDHGAPTATTAGAVTVGAIANLSAPGGESIDAADFSVSVNATNQIVVTLVGTDVQHMQQGQSTTFDVPYTLHGDQVGDTANAVLHVTVNGVNDAPTGAQTFNFNGANSAIGNTSLVLDDGTGPAAPDPAGPQKTISGSLLTGATDVDGPNALTTVAVTNQATTHGHVTISTSGEFSYTPTAGYIGSDSFNYTITDGNAPTPGTVSGSVTIDVATPKVWYVNADAVTDGDGTSANPFNTLTHFQNSGVGNNVDGAGDTIFLYNATNHYTGASTLTLENNEKLVGQDVGLIVNGTTLETATNVNGAIIDGGVVLNSGTTGNTISGVTLGNTGAGTALSGTGFGTLTIDHTVVNTDNNGMILTNGAFGSGAAFTSFTSGGATDVSLTNVTGSVNLGTGSMAGQFAVSGGTVSTTYSGNLSQANNAAMVSVSGGHNTGTLTFQTGTLNATNGTGLQFDNADGTYNFNGTTTLNGGNAGVDILNASGGTFTFGSNTSITSPSGGAFNENASAANVTYNGTITQSSAATAVSATNNTGGTLDFNGAVTANTSTATAVSLTGNNSSTAIQFDGGLNIDTTTGTGFNATGAGTVRVSATAGDESINSTTGQALNLSGMTIGTGGFNLDSTNSGGGANNVHLQSVTGAAVALGTGALGGSTSSAFLVGDGAGGASTGGSTTISYGGTISAANAASVVNIQDHATGAVTLSGNLTHSGTSGAGIVMDDNTSSFTYSGATNSLNTGASGAIAISDQGSGTTVGFSGTLNIDTTTGAGVSLTGTNTGAAFNFTGNNNTIDATGAGNGFAATGGGTVQVTGTGNHIATVGGTALNISNTTIGGSNVIFHDINANGGTNGIVLNTTGASGHLTVTGDGNTALGGNSSGGVIQNATNYGISLANTLSPSFTNMSIHDIGRNGIDGTGVTNFTFDNGQITNTGTAVAGQFEENGIAFVDRNAGPTANTVSGNVAITDSLISGAHRNGIMIETWNGTIGNINISNNTMSGASNASALKNATLATTADIQDAIHVFAQGSAATTANITTGTINNNTISGFEFFNGTINIGGNGIRVVGGSGNAANNAVATLGTAANPIEIGGNDVDNVGSNAIATSFNGQQGLSNFNIHNNGTVANPMSNAEGLGISVFFGGSGTFSALVNNNAIDNNGPTVNAGSAGIAVQLDDGPAAAGNATGVGTIHVNNNTVTNPDGFGIRGIVRASNDTLNLYVQNNNVGTPSATNREAIRIDSGSAVGDTTLNLNMSGNSGPLASTTDNLVGSGIDAGIGLRKQGTVLGVNEFNLQGIAANPTNAQVQAYIGNGGPTNNHTADGSGGSVNGVDIISGSNYGTTNAVPMLAAAGGVQASSPTPGETHLTQAQLDSVVAAAMAQWATAGASASQLAALAAITFSVETLTGDTISEQTPGHIVIDADAAGHGWFVDPTPNDNSEFTHAANAAGTDLYTDPTNAAAGHLDLLTAVTHEMGHELGLPDDTVASDVNDLMYINLVDGERRLPDAADVAQANEADIPQIMQAPAGTPIVAGNAGNDTIDAGHGGNVLFGGAGADTFVFGPGIQLNAPTPAQVTHVADYSAAQGDTFDFSAITSAFHNSGVSDALVVRAVEDASGKFATLQVDHIDPMGMPSAPNWVNVAQLDGAHAGDAVNVLIDNHSVHLAQIHVDLLV
jgi:VCBS repeat-containing protein